MSFNMKNLKKTMDDRYDETLISTFERRHEGYTYVDLSFGGVVKMEPVSVKQMMEPLSYARKKLVRKEFFINIRKNTVVRKKK